MDNCTIISWISDCYYNPPAYLTWWGILLAIVAVVVAIVVPFYLMKWSKPDVKIYFTGWEHRIKVQIQNLPHTNKLLKWIERDPVEISVQLVVDSNSPDVITNPLGAPIVCDLGARDFKFSGDLINKHKQSMLPASSEIYAETELAVVSYKTNKVVLFDENEDLGPSITSGTYPVLVNVRAGGKIITGGRDFTVEYKDNKPVIQWIKEDAKTKLGKT